MQIWAPTPSTVLKGILSIYVRRCPYTRDPCHLPTRCKVIDLISNSPGAVAGQHQRRVLERFGRLWLHENHVNMNSSCLIGCSLIYTIIQNMHMNRLGSAGPWMRESRLVIVFRPCPVQYFGPLNTLFINVLDFSMHSFYFTKPSSLNNGCRLQLRQFPFRPTGQCSRQFGIAPSKP